MGMISVVSSRNNKRSFSSLSLALYTFVTNQPDGYLAWGFLIMKMVLNFFLQSLLQP